MYSEKLIKEVKECYPDYKKIHQLADEGWWNWLLTG
jgi:hypothetical protein